MSKSADRLGHLDAARGLGIILVVGIHAFGYAFPKGTTGAPVLNRLFDEFLGIAVPIFYLVDGFLTTKSASKLLPPSFSEIARKSARRLLVPWVIFNVIYVTFRVLTEWRGIVDTRLFVGRPLSVCIENIWLSNVASQLYFLPTLFLMRLAAYPCRRILTGSVTRLVLFGFAYTAVMRGLGMRLEGDPISHAIVEFPFFLFGCLIQRLEAAGSARAMRIFCAIGIGLIVQRFLPWPADWNGVSFNLAKYGLCLAVYEGSKWMAGPGSPLLWLGGRTMEIYLLHSPIVIRFVGLIAAKATGLNWSRYVFVWGVTLAISIAITLVLARFPRSRILFGQS